MKSEQFGLTAITILSMILAAGGIYVGQNQAMASDVPQKLNEPFAPKAALSLSPSDRDFILSLLEPSSDPNYQIQEISRRYNQAWIAPTLEIFYFVRNDLVRGRLLQELRKTTGQDFGSNVNSWYRWLWNQPEQQIDGYADFKAEFYERIDPRFGKYFRGRQSLARLRLDEVRWGGVQQDGIPPLRHPKMISAQEADYLGDDNVVFGIEVNGDVRAYPKRILAWHEMFTDIVGGVDVAGVYCTLCGTVILYDADYGGLTHELGTSGFLYRSNKLMYDRQTQSLWNTIKGEPLLGPLVDKDIALNHRSVVTTTWGKWKSLHPDTKVLSLNTGHNRNYDEGVAYHDYFATDDLMFNTPFQDSRLDNKSEVLALRFKGQLGKTVAIDTDYLKRNPVYQSTLGTQKYVVITDSSGANRVYDPGGIEFVETNGNTVTDKQGVVWTITESQLEHPNGAYAKRLPYHRAFWFGWHATFPKTELIK